MNPAHNQIKEASIAVCRFCAGYKSANSVSAGSATANIVRRQLETLVRHIYDELQITPEDHLQTAISKGVSVFPKVPWISIVPQGGKVSRHLSVTVCFSPDGNGFVAGTMAPATETYVKYPTVKRRPADIRVNVNGPSSKSHYNNAFLNPQEFLADSFEPQDLLNHLKDSILLMRTF